MSERKVLNKYYPRDYDPSKIPRAKRPKNRQWTIRTMAPFNMRCNTCGEYIYKGKKFNSRQEVAEGETYLGLKIFRFYIKCPRCVAEISFKTDPENVDYQMEGGATRNFEALRTAELMAEREAKEKEEELENNPMKMLENRTKASQREMDMLETLEDLKDMNSKHAKVNTEDIILKYRLYEEKLQQLQDEEDEAFVQSVFGKSGDMTVKRLQDDSDESDEDKPGPSKVAKMEKPTDFLTEGSTLNNEASTSGAAAATTKKAASTLTKSVGMLSSSKSSLGMLVKKKQPSKSAVTVTNADGKTDNVSCDADKKSESDHTDATKDYTMPSDINQDNNQDHRTTVIKGSDGKNNGSSTVSHNIQPASNSLTGGLSLLGAYSDSESNEDSD